MFENVRVVFGQGLGEIFGKWSKTFGKWLKRSFSVGLYSKQNNTWSLVVMGYLTLMNLVSNWISRFFSAPRKQKTSNLTFPLFGFVFYERKTKVTQPS